MTPLQKKVFAMVPVEAENGTKVSAWVPAIVMVSYSLITLFLI